MLGSMVLVGCATSRLGSPPASDPTARMLKVPRIVRPSVTLAWTNPPIELIGNSLWQGGAPGLYTNLMLLPVSETVSLTNVPPGVYYFAVTDTDTNGLESPFSNEVVWSNTVPPPVTNFLLSVTIQQSSDFTNWTTFTNAGQFQATNSGAPVYWRALMNIQPQ